MGDRRRKRKKGLDENKKEEAQKKIKEQKK